MTAEVRDDLVPRIYFDEPVLLHVAGEEQPMPGRATNLSRAGIFVNVDHLTHELEGTVGVEFELPDEGTRVGAEARIIRHVLPDDPLEPAGLALCFTRLVDGCSEPLNRFLSERLQPATGHMVRIKLGELGFPIRAQAHSVWSNVLSVDAELPFLRLGSPVTVPLQDALDDELPLQGNIRWVSVHVPPESGVPRLNIGIEMEPDENLDQGLGEDWDEWVDDELDPVHTEEFAQHSRLVAARAQAERRAAG